MPTATPVPPTNTPVPTYAQVVDTVNRAADATDTTPSFGPSARLTIRFEVRYSALTSRLARS